MAKPVRRRHIAELSAQLENITDAIVAVRLGAEHEAERKTKAGAGLSADFARVEALLTGVKTALERMGGTTLPAFREDISSVRAQMSELQHEMADYGVVLRRVANYAEAMHIRYAEDNPQPPVKPRRRGRPRKEPEPPPEDTSQKLIDEPEQELDLGIEISA